MQASTGPSEARSGYSPRRGHAPHLSISDENHHVTEAIGYMYDDDYDRRDSRRLSYMSSPLSETISTSSNMSGSDSTRSPAAPAQDPLPRAPANDKEIHRPNGRDRRSAIISGSFDRENGPPSPTLNRSQSDTATTSFPLNDIDYESDPAAVAQELSNLAAIRRMSMDVTATGDPDLPALNSNMMPSIAPSASADEDDTSRLFWVPARIHPELAPKEFKSFLESKSDQIQRKAGEQGSLTPERQNSGSSLRRKKSMLSRQIDNSDSDGGENYKDGAERLEHKRSSSQRRHARVSPNLQDLEALVEDKQTQHTRSSSLSESTELDEDRPILPPAPPGHSLRRSTRTTYRKSSLKKGERVPYSRRVARTPGTSIEEPISTAKPGATPSPEEALIRPLARVSTDPTPSVDKANANYSQPASERTPTGSTPGSTTGQQEPGNRASAPPQTRQWHSRISSNGKSTLQIPPSGQQVPQILESPPQDDDQPTATATAQRHKLPERVSSHDPPPSQPPQVPLPPEPTGNKAKKLSLGKSSKESNQTINEMASHPSPLPGNSTRTDSLSFIPTLTEDKKSEGKKSKDKKDSEGGRKSSWHWLLGNEEKDKDKKRDEESKKSKAKASKAAEKAHDNTRLDILNTSIEGGQRGRESLVLERDSKLEEERKKESARRTSGGEPKKEKESGLFSSIFGVGRKKSSDGHKKSSSRNLSPEPPPRELKPDIDYNWTRFSILEERAIYRMAHIKLANPRRPLHSQVLLSNFMYSYLAKVQQMHPQMSLPTSSAQKQQQPQQQNSDDQADEYTQYQRYQQTQDQHYMDGASYGGDSHIYDYDDDDDRDDLYRTQSRDSKHTYENGNLYGQQGRHQQLYGASYSSYGDTGHGDGDEMW